MVSFPEAEMADGLLTLANPEAAQADGTADALPHIFEPFYRADPSRSQQIPGFGLGLAVVRMVAARHGGAIEVTTQGGRLGIHHNLWGQSCRQLKSPLMKQPGQCPAAS